MNVSDSETFAYIESLTTETVLTCGQLLVRARQSAGFGEDEVAEKLHLLPSVVRALEADNFAAIRSPVFCRGYLTSYAKLLGLNVDEVMALYQRQQPSSVFSQNISRPEVSVVFKPVAIGPSRTSFFKRYGKSLMAMAASFFVIGMLFVFNNTSLNSKLDAPSGAASNAVHKDFPAVQADHKSEKVPAKNMQTNNDSIASMPILLPGNELHIADQSGKEVASNAAPLKIEAAPVSSSDLANENEDKLSLRFTDKCWVEIRDSNNIVIASGVYRANDILNLSGKAPFKLHLGFAPGVNVALNGEDIDIGEGDAKDHTARIVIGSS